MNKVRTNLLNNGDSGDFIDKCKQKFTKQRDQQGNADETQFVIVPP